MNSEFDDFDQDFDDLDEELPNFDEDFSDFDQNDIDFDIEISEVEFPEVDMRTAILSKNNLVALLCLKIADKSGAICRVDPRESTPAVQLYDDPEKAIEWYKKSLRTSKQNGWNIVYDGLPLEG